MIHPTFLRGERAHYTDRLFAVNRETSICSWENARSRRGQTWCPDQTWCPALAGPFKVRLTADTTSIYYFGATQLKLLASLRSPDPLYMGTCGCGQSGRWNATPFAASLSTYLV